MVYYFEQAEGVLDIPKAYLTSGAKANIVVLVANIHGVQSAGGQWDRFLLLA